MASRRRGIGLGLCCAVLTFGGPAAAQVSGDLTLQSDFRLRGHSLSEGEPALTLTASYDHPTGIYLNGSATGSSVEGDPEVIGLTGNVGYARRLTPEVSLDGGVMWSQYRSRFHFETTVDYTEAYVGFYSRRLSSHLYYSPEYYYPGVEALYGELEGAMETAAKVRLSAHVGMLSYLATPYGFPDDSEYDWRLAAARQFGPIDFRAALSGGGPEPDYYDYRPQDRTAFVVSASWTF